MYGAGGPRSRQGREDYTSRTQEPGPTWTQIRRVRFQWCPKTAPERACLFATDAQADSPPARRRLRRRRGLLPRGPLVGQAGPEDPDPGGEKRRGGGEGWEASELGPGAREGIRRSSAPSPRRVAGAGALGEHGAHAVLGERHVGQGLEEAAGRALVISWALWAQRPPRRDRPRPPTRVSALPAREGGFHPPAWAGSARPPGQALTWA